MGKKQQTESVNSKLALVMKSGKAVLGYKQTLKALRKGTLKAMFVAHNTPSIVKAEVNYYSRLSNTPIYHYLGNNIDLGSACGRYHRVAILGIIDAGDSDILNLLYLRDNYNDKTQFNEENENSFHAQSELFENEEDEPEENFYNEEIEVIHEENIRYYDLYEDIQRHPLDEDYYN